MADFHELPDSIRGHNAPVVQTSHKGEMIPVGTYMVRQGFFDIFFPTGTLLRRLSFHLRFPFGSSAKSILLPLPFPFPFLPLLPRLLQNPLHVLPPPIHPIPPP
jgi:hypothetical protein